MLKLVDVALFCLAIVLTLGAIPYVVLIWIDCVKLIKDKLNEFRFPFKLKKGGCDA